MIHISYDKSISTAACLIEVPAVARRKWTRQAVRIVLIGIFLPLLTVAAPILLGAPYGYPLLGIFVSAWAWTTFGIPRLTKELDSLRYENWTSETEELLAPVKFSLSQTKLTLRDIRPIEHDFVIAFVEKGHIETLTVRLVRWVESQTPYVRFTSPTDDAAESMAWSAHNESRVSGETVTVTVDRGSAVEIGVPDPTDPTTWPRSLH